MSQKTSEVFLWRNKHDILSLKHQFKAAFLLFFNVSLLLMLLLVLIVTSVSFFFHFFSFVSFRLSAVLVFFFFCARFSFMLLVVV